VKNTTSILPSEISTRELHGYLLGAIGPRPIAFASTMDDKGNPNLSPFSFFNVFSANPPILIFSPARRVRNNTTKHTLENVLATHEVVINIVNYELVQQMSLSSTEYPEGVNEFIKSGLTMLPSDLIKPYRVGESPVQFECKVTKVEALGDDGGAGNLVFAEVVKIHIHKDILDDNGGIDQFKLDQVARMGGNFYSRAREGLFEVPKPLATLGIGVDEIPDYIRRNKGLSGNHLGMLANIEAIPTSQEVSAFIDSNMDLRSLLSADNQEQLTEKAIAYLMQKDIASAWKILMAREIH